MNYIEHLKTDRVPAGLRIDSTISVNIGLARCFRLLSGSVVVQANDARSTRLTQFVLDPPFNARSIQKISRLASMLGDGLSITELEELCIGKAGRNEIFFKSLADEIAWTLYYQKNKNYIGSFIFLYRALESASYSFPMIYSTRSRDFKQSFNELRDVFSSKDNRGELAVFRKFVKSNTQDTTLQQLTYIIDLSLLSTNEFKKLEKKLREIAPSLYKDTNPSVVFDETVSEISIQFNSMPDFIISFRNALVHLQSGSNRNFGASELYNFEDLCKKIVAIGVQFLATVFLLVCEAL